MNRITLTPRGELVALIVSAVACAAVCYVGILAMAAIA